MAILVLNAGSSSLKYALIEASTASPEKLLTRGVAECLGTPQAVLRCANRPPQSIPDGSLTTVLAVLLEQLGAGVQLSAIGHRVVHGGEYFTSAALIDEAVIAAITDCVRLAPLHNPGNLAGIAATRQLFPQVPQVAVFDTAFHQTLPEIAWRYAVPEAWYRDHGVRRYGFHGTSHQYVAERAAMLLDRPLSSLRLLTVHLGNGCSACAIRNGVSVDTTMGMTPMEGLVMGTRCGDIDPGLIAHLVHGQGMELATVMDCLNRQAGLLGLSGLSNDLRQLTRERAAGHPRARLAIDIFCYRLAKALAALVVPLGGLDALIFTGGIGEHSDLVRQLTLSHLTWLGLVGDEALNATVQEGPIDRERRVWVIPTDEEGMIARETARVIAVGASCLGPGVGVER
jgi:acetate kinase